LQAAPQTPSPVSVVAERTLGAWAAGVLRLMRPRQWPKNAFVLAAVVFSGRWTDPWSLGRALVAAAAFCLLSSAVYALNDLSDRHVDRLHPTKRHRPLASGLLRPWEGAAVGVGALVLGLALCTLTGWRTTAAGVGYLLLNVLYSTALKHVAIWDTLTVALGFVARALAGALAVGVQASPWLLTCTFLVTLYVSLAKRWAEEVAVERRRAQGLEQAELGFRRTTGQVSTRLLREFMVISMGATLVSYALYCLDSPHGSLELVTLPFVVYGLFRFQFLAETRLEIGQAPEESLLGDRPFLLNTLIWGLVVAAVALAR